MTYSKTTWRDGDIITSSKLNQLETATENCSNVQGGEGPKGQTGDPGLPGNAGQQGPMGVVNSGIYANKQEVDSKIQEEIRKAGLKSMLLMTPEARAGGEKGDAGTILRYRGTWMSGTSYVNNSTYIDTVDYQGRSYICRVSNSNQPVSQTGYWMLMAEKGNQGPAGPTGEPGDATSDAATVNNMKFWIGNKQKFDGTSKSSNTIYFVSGVGSGNNGGGVSPSPPPQPTDSYRIYKELTRVKLDPDLDYVGKGEPLTVALKPDPGMKIGSNLSIRMGERDITYTYYSFSTGILDIYAVNGEIRIKATASPMKELSIDYEYDDNVDIKTVPLIVKADLVYDRTSKYNSMPYHVYKIKNENIVKGKLTNREVKICVTEKIKLKTNVKYELYLVPFDDVPNSLIHPRLGIVEVE